MPIYDFIGDADFSIRPDHTRDVPLQTGVIPGIKQSSDVDGGRNYFDGVLHHPQHLEEFIIPGFRSLDEAMKQYWTGIRVPTKNSYRFMRVKIAGGDKSLMIWNDDLIEGRVRLPVAAISREGHDFNKDKFSPRYHHMGVRYLNTRGNLVAKVYRPVPYLVNYKLTIWSEHKRDAEYILYQILTRFNPIAEFRMFDKHLVGNVQLRYEGSTDASDKESGFDQKAEVRYEVSMTAEAWLPLPETIVPTILGRVATVKEQDGTILASYLGELVNNTITTTTE